MEASKRFIPPERNPKTHAEHRREVFWQIILPLMLGVILLLAAIAAIIFSATQPASELNRWADISLMWLILPSLIIALLGFVILVGFVYLVTMLLRLTPRYARIVQVYIELARTKISQITNLAAEPFLRAHSILAILNRMTRGRKTPRE